MWGMTWDMLQIFCTMVSLWWSHKKTIVPIFCTGLSLCGTNTSAPTKRDPCGNEKFLPNSAVLMQCIVLKSSSGIFCDAAADFLEENGPLKQQDATK